MSAHAFMQSAIMRHIDACAICGQPSDHEWHATPTREPEPVKRKVGIIGNPKVNGLDLAAALVRAVTPTEPSREPSGRLCYVCRLPEMSESNPLREVDVSVLKHADCPLLEFAAPVEEPAPAEPPCPDCGGDDLFAHEMSCPRAEPEAEDERVEPMPRPNVPYPPKRAARAVQPDTEYARAAADPAFMADMDALSDRQPDTGSGAVFDVEGALSGPIERVERLRPTQRREFFAYIEARWCWDCGEEHEACQCGSHDHSACPVCTPPAREIGQRERARRAYEVNARRFSGTMRALAGQGRLTRAWAALRIAFDRFLSTRNAKP